MRILRPFSIVFCILAMSACGNNSIIGPDPPPPLPMQSESLVARFAFSDLGAESNGGVAKSINVPSAKKLEVDVSWIPIDASNLKVYLLRSESDMINCSTDPCKGSVNPESVNDEKPGERVLTFSNMEPNSYILFIRNRDKMAVASGVARISAIY
jgi:hypothetical protein